jgi:hypothetical protein
VSNVLRNAGLRLIGGVLLLAGCASEPPPTAGIDFHRDVAPIFKAHCLNCHGQQQQQGGLRLDDRMFALAGGLSGKKLVGKSVEDSELLRRVLSDNPIVAMPKEGGRLTAAEVETLRRWVQANGPWPDKVPPSGRDEFLVRYGEDFSKRLGVFGGEPKVYGLLLFAIFVGIAERLRRVSSDHERWSQGWRRHLQRLFRPVSLAGFLLVVISVVLWDVIGFTMRQSSYIAITEQSLSEATAAGESRPVSLNGPSPTPLRPRGAAGLGGVYYRGNDERSEKLFNGGDYRTATLRLSLLDEHDRPVALGQTLDGSQLVIRLEIERAAHATPSLFTDELMAGILLSRRAGDRQEPLPTDEPAKMEAVEVGERWVAKYRLGEFTGQPDVALNGVVYLYSNAVRRDEAVQGTLQYGIVFALRIRERTLQENSELWLGPILLPGNFQHVTPGRILLNEWLDTQPIPKIVGENSTDPILLGIPEHLGKGAKLPEQSSAPTARPATLPE